MINHLVCEMHQFCPTNCQKAKDIPLTEKQSSKSSQFRRWNQQMLLFFALTSTYQNCELLVSAQHTHENTEKLSILHAHTKYKLNFNFPYTHPPPPPCTSNPGQFLSPVWGTSDVGGCGSGRTGGQDVSLIITPSDLLPAPDSLPPAPDTSSTDGVAGRDGGTGGGAYGPGLTASSSSRATFRILPETDTMPWSANSLILHPPFFMRPLLPLRSPLLPWLPC